MKKLLTILLVMLSTLAFSQFPIIEEFDAGSTWTYTNGAGLQNYGGAENYATFNVNTTPYPNSSTVTITSPIYDLTSCLSGLEVSYIISGEIELFYDFAYFDYWNGSAWITVNTYTGFVNTTENFMLPNTATQFRFRLVSDGSVNTYTTGPWWNQTTSPYYYDITSITIDCISVLPIELIDFDGYADSRVNNLYWITATEINNDYFLLEKSEDGIYWTTLAKVDGAGNSSNEIRYEYLDEHPFVMTSYYRLSQVDFDGVGETFDVIAITNESGVFYTYSKSEDNNIYLSSPEYFEFYNMMGQVVVSGSGNVIETKGLTQGVYILKVEGGYTQKFFIR